MSERLSFSDFAYRSSCLVPRLNYRVTNLRSLERCPLRRGQLVILILVTSIGILLPSNAARSESNLIFNGSEKSIYFLDISKSSDSQRLWQLLRTSLLEKVDTALGAPSRPGIKKPKLPTDLSISIIDKNSQAAPIVEIISIKDAERIWGFIINKVGGGKPTSLRLESIANDFFGSSGVYTTLISDYALQETIANVSTQDCTGKAEAAFLKSNFMDNVSAGLRSEASKEVCNIIVKLTKGINEADRLFSSPNCGKGSCSDVVGAVQRAAAVSADLGRDAKKGNPKLCIAIASDMLNHYPGISQSSPWNTMQAIKKVASPADAERLGSTVARDASVSFTSKVKVRVDVIGQGASTNFPRELRSKLDAYWNGFWSAAGVPVRSQKASLDQACK